jgi:hypothetical protein
MDTHCRRPATRRPPRGHHRNHQPRYALIWPKSGHVVFDYDVSRELAGALEIGAKLSPFAMI